MTEREALNQGLRYTGMSWRVFDTSKGEHYKKRVAELKKQYNCRAVIVRDRDGWNSYYGDDNFCAVQYDSPETCQRMIDTRDEKMAKLKEEYESKVAELEKWIKMWEDKKAKFIELKK